MVIDLMMSCIERFPGLLRFVRVSHSRLLWLRDVIAGICTGSEFVRFRCNICGNNSVSTLSVVRQRESPSCCYCGSTRRRRSVIAALSEELFGEAMAMPDLKISKQITGIGLSDSDYYAKILGGIFSYTNTYYHKEPRLDIMSVKEEMFDKADFVISSDVFEHIPPPVDRAFENLFKLLKKGGVCIFSVPYKDQGVTEEHFPELFDYKIVERAGKKVLINKTRQGDLEVFEDLKFHGGRGNTLETREFSRASLLDNIRGSGFTDIKLHDRSIPGFGVLIREGEPSLVISMRKV